MTDLELVDRFQKGDESAFNELVLRYKEKVYWTARRFLQNHDDADEVVQQSFLKAYVGLKNFRSDSGVFTWLYRIAVNTALNVLRKQRTKEFFRLDELTRESSPESDRPDEQYERKEERALIDEAVHQLPEKQRAVFVLRYYDQLSYEEIAVILKTSVGGLKANYFHAMRKIEEYVRRAHGS
ncbi:MAG: sigma-70 family RNA polymerase sigma factor [Ignavibacteriales bacterium]|nr:sigma-70 family RNA polymerase sigma factor [Ignavibacteriales bacterium]